MEKKCFAGMKMFPNSIHIKLANQQEYFFTSFLKNGRKYSYNLIKPLSPNLQPNVIERNGSTIVVTSSDSSFSQPSLGEMGDNIHPSSQTLMTGGAQEENDSD